MGQTKDAAGPAAGVFCLNKTAKGKEAAQIPKR